jgi:hypothetical protein
VWAIALGSFSILLTVSSPHSFSLSSSWSAELGSGDELLLLQSSLQSPSVLTLFVKTCKQPSGQSHSADQQT